MNTLPVIHLLVFPCMLLFTGYEGCMLTSIARKLLFHIPLDIVTFRSNKESLEYILEEELQG